MKRTDIEDKEPETTASKGKKALLETARRRFKLCQEAEEKQREREREDLRFQVPENQWDDESKKARKGDSATPARPMLSISKLDQPVGLITNQMRAADLGIVVQPVSEDADDDTAEAFQGIYRDIERRSRADLARAWAFDRAVKAGRGAYRVLTEYDDESDEPSDQRIVIQRILHQESVYFDPAANEPDFSDGQFAFVGMWVSADEFKAQYPKARAVSKSGNRLEWEQLSHEAPEWVREDDVLVCEYWYKVHEDEEFEVVIAGEPQKRKRDKVTVHCAKLCGWEVLEEWAWLGKWIPLIPTLGRELQPFDEERHWSGVIGPAKDGQRLYNYSASVLVERMGLEPKAPWIANAEVIEGYEDEWQQSNSRNFPVLHYNTKVVGGTLLPPPMRAQIDMSGMSVAMAALQEADQFIQASTAVFDPSLGRMPQKERSGRAIMALQQQADAGTSHFLRNLTDVSMTYEAKVIVDLIPKIYDRPARIVRIIRGDDRKSEPIMVNSPFTMDPQTKRPVRADQMPPQQAPMPQQGMPPGPQGVPMAPGQPQGAPAQAPPPRPKVKNYDLKKGTYGVSVTVGKSFQTRLQEGSDQIGQLLTAKPELFMLMGDLFLRFQDWPGAKEMADRMAKVREKQFPGIGEGEDGEQPPEALKAQLEQQGQQMQGLQQQVQGLTAALQTKQAEQQAKLQVAEMDRTTKLEISKADNETKLLLKAVEQRMAAQDRKFDLMLETLKMAHSVAATHQAQDHEDTRRREDMDHEDVSTERSQMHEMDMEAMKPQPALDEPMVIEEGIE